MKLEKLRGLVQDQYQQQRPGRDPWCDWMYDNHVLWVADKAHEYSKRFGGNADIAVAGALLHDIADTVIPRDNPKSEQESLQIGRMLCEKAGYDTPEVELIVDDIVLKHSCRDGVVPDSHEGKVMASADSAAHFLTDFYLHAFSAGTNFGDYKWQMGWVRQKIEKDFHKKIFFDEVKEEVRPVYDALRLIVSA